MRYHRFFCIVHMAVRRCTQQRRLAMVGTRKPQRYPIKRKQMRYKRIKNNS